MTILNQRIIYKDDIEFVTEFPCLLGHPVRYEKPFSGMIMSGFFTIMFGSARTFGIHSIWYLFFAQILGGIFQSTGWPGMSMDCCVVFICYADLNCINYLILFRCCNSNCKLVRERKTGSHYGNLEFTHISWKHSRFINCWFFCKL